MSQFNAEKAEELGIPGHMHGGLKRWIDDGIEPGSFLLAVLENNLRDAVGCADQMNMGRLPNYVRFLYNYAPSGCWGSKEKVAAWEKAHADARASSGEAPTPKGGA